MKILIIGDIYGKTGREALAELLPELKKHYNPNWIIANGENVTAGNGLSARHARFLRESGVEIITTGNHLFARPDWPKLMEKDDTVLRPHNLGALDAPGTGFKVFEKEDNSGHKLGIINLAGRVFMERARCPFRVADELIANFDEGVPIIVDFHAEATSEKLALAWYLDGRVTAVVGTHTHVQTSDERILPGGTATITDLGMTGSLDGILGVDRETIVGRFRKGFSDKFQCAGGVKKIEGVFLEIDENSKARKIERFRFPQGVFLS